MAIFNEIGQIEGAPVLGATSPHIRQNRETFANHLRFGQLS